MKLPSPVDFPLYNFFVYNFSSERMIWCSVGFYPEKLTPGSLEAKFNKLFNHIQLIRHSAFFRTQKIKVTEWSEKAPETEPNRNFIPEKFQSGPLF